MTGAFHLANVSPCSLYSCLILTSQLLPMRMRERDARKGREDGGIKFIQWDVLAHSSIMMHITSTLKYVEVSYHYVENIK